MSEKGPCEKCNLLGDVFKEAPEGDHWTWAYTELFCMLHGADHCKVSDAARRLAIKVGLSKRFGYLLPVVKRCNDATEGRHD